MMQISLCMIVLNEEKNLPRCLDSIKDAVDEIIIVDTGSTDATKAVAGKYTSKIYDFEWCDDFSAARNFSFSHATKDFVMWLDADDIMLKEDVTQLIALKNQLTDNVDAVMLKYNNGFDENGKVVFSYYRERLANRSRGFLWVEPVHEYLAVSGNIIRRDIAVTHARAQGESNSSRNLKIYESLLKNGDKLSPRGIYYYARELKDSRNFNLAAVYFKKFLREGLGWVEDNISACLDLYRCLSALDSEV
ncbi:MAG: glycosyltransferase family 2 protein, partial [Clostridia bacterium]